MPHTDVNINNKEDAKLLEMLSKGRLSDKTIMNLSVVLSKALPLVLKKLIDENQALKESQHELLEKFEKSESKMQDVFKQALVSQSIEENDLRNIPAEARTLLRDYISTKKTNSILSENLENLVNDIKTLGFILKNNDIKDLDVINAHSHQEIVNLKTIITEKISILSKDIVSEIERDITEAIKTGNYSHLLEKIMKEINVLIVERMSDFVKPYDQLSQKFVKGEISHDHFTENLKRSALIQHLREKVIEDIIVAIEANNLDSSKVPTKLKHAIERIVKNNELMYNTDLQSLLGLNLDSEPETYLRSEKHSDDEPSTKRPHMFGKVI